MIIHKDSLSLSLLPTTCILWKSKQSKYKLSKPKPKPKSKRQTHRNQRLMQHIKDLLHQTYFLTVGLAYFPDLRTITYTLSPESYPLPYDL